MPRKSEVEDGAPEQKKKRPQNEGTALRMTLAVKNATEQRNSGTLAYKIKCRCKNQAKKGELCVEGIGRTRLHVGWRLQTTWVR
jgi:hypothetical protein